MQRTKAGSQDRASRKGGADSSFSLWPMCMRKKRLRRARGRNVRQARERRQRDPSNSSDSSMMCSKTSTGKGGTRLETGLDWGMVFIDDDIVAVRIRQRDRLRSELVRVMAEAFKLKASLERAGEGSRKTWKARNGVVVKVKFGGPRARGADWLSREAGTWKFSTSSRALTERVSRAPGLKY